MGESQYIVEAGGVRWKRSTLAGADPASFVVLGEQYGRDGAQAYFRSKRVRLKRNAGGSLATFREIGPSVATDGAWLYHGTKQIEPPSGTQDGGFDWAAARYRPFEADRGHLEGINFAAGVLSDGARHFAAEFLGGWYEVPTSAIEPVELDGGSPCSFVSDGTFHAYRAREVEAARGRSVRALAPDVLAAGEEVFVGTEPFRGRRASELRWIVGQSLHAGDAILVVDGRRGEVVQEVAAAPPLSLEDAAQAFLDAVVPRTASALDRYLPVATILADADLDVPAPGGPVAFRLVEASPDALRIDVHGEVLSAAPDGWYELACSAWSRARSGPDRFVAFMHFGTMLPDTSGLALQILALAQAEALDLASALARAGGLAAARMLAHAVLVQAWRRGDPEPELLAHLAPELADCARYRPRRHGFTVTTNLGAAKLITGEGWLADPDPFVRLEMVDTLIGATLESAKGEKTLPLAVPALIERLDVEERASVRAALWTALDGCTVKATVMAEVRGVGAYAMLELATRRLIQDRVNTRYNQVRLFEALIGLGRDDEAEAVAADLIASAPPDHPCPGPYTHREVFPSFAAALDAARERAVRG